ILLDSVRTNLRNLAVHHGRELIYDYVPVRLKQSAGQLNPELLAIGQDAVRTHPGRDRVETNRLTGGRDFLHRQGVIKIVNDRIAPPTATAVRRRTLPAAGWISRIPKGLRSARRSSRTSQSAA